MNLPQAKADLPRWTGVFPAGTTKFKPNEDLDVAEMERHFEFQIAGGVDGHHSTRPRHPPGSESPVLN